jgi:hypothetical protein
VAKGDGLETGFQDGPHQVLRSSKRKRINNQQLATILTLTLTPHLTLILTPTLTLTPMHTNPNPTGSRPSLLDITITVVMPVVKLRLIWVNI